MYVIRIASHHKINDEVPEFRYSGNQSETNSLCMSTVKAVIAGPITGSEKAVVGTLPLDHLKMLKSHFDSKGYVMGQASECKKRAKPIASESPSEMEIAAVTD